MLGRVVSRPRRLNNTGTLDITRRVSGRIHLIVTLRLRVRLRTDPVITELLEISSVDGTIHTISIDINEDGIDLIRSV